MFGYPSDFETDVRIDASDLEYYVRENWDFFKEKCDPLNIDKKENLQDLSKQVKDVLDDFDDVRRLRDSSHEYDRDYKVLLYNHLTDIYNKLIELVD